MTKFTAQDILDISNVFTLKEFFNEGDEFDENKEYATFKFSNADVVIKYKYLTTSNGVNRIDFNIRYTETVTPEPTPDAETDIVVELKPEIVTFARLPIQWDQMITTFIENSPELKNEQYSCDVLKTAEVNKFNVIIDLTISKGSQAV